MALLQLLTLGGYGGMLPQENFDDFSVLRRILVHSEAYTEKHTELLEKRLIIAC